MRKQFCVNGVVLLMYRTSSAECFSFFCFPQLGREVCPRGLAGEDRDALRYGDVAMTAPGGGVGSFLSSSFSYFEQSVVSLKETPKEKPD